MNIDSLTIRPLVRSELDVAVDWAAAEGWNPGLHDADVFWQCDPGGFVGIEHEGELIATGSIVAYGRDYGFMGFFIVRPDLRGKGIGTKLWFHRRDLLNSRLKEGGAIGMDGVFDMQDWYAKGGFVFSHRNLRMQGVAAVTGDVVDEVVELGSIPFEQIAAYDLQCFAYQRDRFLRSWIEMPNARALGFVRDGNLLGFGVVRECREGYKIGPLFADEDEVAEALFVALTGGIPGETVSLDIPETHAGAVALAARHGLTEVFGCARMYYGELEPMNWAKIYGITTFELG